MKPSSDFYNFTKAAAHGLNKYFFPCVYVKVKIDASISLECKKMCKKM